MSPEAEDRWASCNRLLRRRGEPPLTEFQVAECWACYLERRGAMADQSRVDHGELVALIRDIQHGTIRADAQVWGHPRVRSVMQGGFAASAELIIRAALNGKGVAADSGMLD